jgi:hypothetical protein
MTNSSPDTTPLPIPLDALPKGVIKGVSRLRRTLGQAVGRNIHISISPDKAVDILLALDHLVQRKSATEPVYLDKNRKQLRR